MDITRAFSYVFEDDDWIGKVVMVVIWVAISAIPLLGLIGWAALAGYVVEMLRNMRRGDQHPLPRWDNLGEKITDGANVLIASFVYNIGNLLVICGMALLFPALGVMDSGDGVFASTASLALSCCLGLVLLVYNLIIWPVLGVGTLYYSQTRQIGVYFQFGRIWATINRHMSTTIQWMIYSFLASFVLGLLNIIPCIGWLASVALTLPVQAHLLGQYGAQIEDKPKNKPKRVEPRR